ncbi:MAG: alpha/beta fold hydrolase [Anaerolineales bacterium]|nr:alpha/beta fold hydrolase [Anaerolineales bacterium]
MVERSYQNEVLVDAVVTGSSAHGEFIELSDGVTYYELGGPEDGQVVVLVHGFAIPCQIWEPTFEFLSKAGFRVLRYDLFGRGFSARPQGRYNLDLFDRQLDELISRLELHEPVDLIGLSMGGVISVAFCDRHSQRVRKLCLIDPAGYSTQKSVLLRILAAPVVGEVLIDLFGEWFLLNRIRSEHRGQGIPAYYTAAKDQFGFNGYKRALLSTIRNDCLRDQSRIYQRVGAQGQETLLIWGKRDNLIPLKLSEKVCQAIPTCELWVIEDARHIPHYEKPEDVNRILLNCLLR